MNFSFSSEKFWNRLGHPNAMGGPLLVLALIFIAVLSFAFDAVRLGDYSWSWIPVNVVGVCLGLVVVIPAQVIQRRRNPQQDRQPWFNISFSSLFFGIKNLSTLYVAPIFGIADVGEPAYRFIGGLIIGFSVLALYTNFVGNRLERESALVRLQETEQELISFREAAFGKLEEENKEAALNAYKALSPQLNDLREAVKESKDILTLASKLSEFIKSELRPFSRNLSMEAIKLSKSADSSSNSIAEPEITVNLSNSIRIWNTVVPVPLVLFVLTSFVIPRLTASEIVIASLIFTATLALIKLATAWIKPMSVLSAFVATTALAYLSAVPVYMYLYSIPNPNGIPELLPAFLIIPAWSFIAASLAHILDLKQAKIEEMLSSVIKELSRENKLYEQKAWLASHSWYLLLHGVVQPALTSASIRVSRAERLDSATKMQVMQDLQRAIDALSQNRATGQTLSTSISEIQSVWEGVSEVKVDIAPEVQELALKNQLVNTVLNEILKEVVSNAIRHGNALSVVANVLLLENTNLMILITNDGLKPTREKIESVGSKMLDAFCIERTLNWNQVTQRTEFKAVVPF